MRFSVPPLWSSFDPVLRAKTTPFAITAGSGISRSLDTQTGSSIGACVFGSAITLNAIRLPCGVGPLVRRNLGRKDRAVPLWTRTAHVLRVWFQELGDRFGEFAFPSARAKRLSRHGVSFLLSRLADRAATACPTSVTSGFRRT